MMMIRLDGRNSNAWKGFVLEKKRRIRSLLAAVCLSLVWPETVNARFMQIIYIDRDVPQCEAIFIGAITGVAKKGTTRWGPETLDNLIVSTVVQLPLKGHLAKGQKFSFQHWKAQPASGNMMNGYSSFNFKESGLYLLFLKKDERGVHLAAPEDWRTVQFSPAMLDAAKAAPQKTDLTAYVLDVLNKILEVQTDNCSATLSLLEGSQIFDARLHDPETKAAFVKKLHDLTKTAKDDNTLLTTYTYLGKLREVNVIPDIVEYIVSGSGTSVQRTNAIDWLQGFREEEQKKALQTVIVRSKDERVLEYARKRFPAAD